MVTAKAVSHTDIKGKVQHYIQVSNGASSVFINVGDKTYNGVKELEKIEQLPFEDDNKTTTEQEKEQISASNSTKEQLEEKIEQLPFEDDNKTTTEQEKEQISASNSTKEQLEEKISASNSTKEQLEEKIDKLNKKKENSK